MFILRGRMERDSPLFKACALAYQDFNTAIDHLLKADRSRRHLHMQSVTALARPVYDLSSPAVYEAAGLLHQRVMEYLQAGPNEEITARRRITAAQAAFGNAVRKELGN